jgi:hypothetical protein
MDEKKKSARTQYQIGLWGILAGIVLLIFFWPLGILLIIAGGLAALTNYAKSR